MPHVAEHRLVAPGVAGLPRREYPGKNSAAAFGDCFDRPFALTRFDATPEVDFAVLLLMVTPGYLQHWWVPSCRRIPLYTRMTQRHDTKSRSRIDDVRKSRFEMFSQPFRFSIHDQTSRG